MLVKLPYHITQKCLSMHGVLGHWTNPEIQSIPGILHTRIPRNQNLPTNADVPRGWEKYNFLPTSMATVPPSAMGSHVDSGINTVTIVIIRRRWQKPNLHSGERKTTRQRQDTDNEGCPHTTPGWTVPLQQLTGQMPKQTGQPMAFLRVRFWQSKPPWLVTSLLVNPRSHSEERSSQMSRSRASRQALREANNTFHEECRHDSLTWQQRQYHKYKAKSEMQLS